MWYKRGTVGAPIAFLLLFFPNFLFAQQNLFNIPSGDITQNGKFFYQHQFNIYERMLESKGHLVYGLGKGWDVGLNLVGKGMYFTPEWRVLYNSNPEKGALYPYLMPTAQKQFNLSPHVDVNIGTQFGVNLSNRIANKRAAYFNYAIGTVYFMEKKSRLVGGVYQANRFFIGDGNDVGLLLGYEIKVSTNLYMVGDWVSGRNDAGVAVIGGMYNLGKRAQLCAGVLLPNPDNPKPMGVVLELNLLGWDNTGH